MSMQFNLASRPVRILSACALTGVLSWAHAQTAPPLDRVSRLPEIVVTGEAEADETVQGPFLPPVLGTQINAGKKTSVMDLDALPTIIGNNYRQALAMTPGLLLSEETSPLISLGYRGLNPHRAQFTQVLKDGIPIHADMFGYPEAYYTPPLDTVDRMEFIRGGASLMFGPQPGGSLNFVTHRPRLDREFSIRSQHIFGSDNLYSTFNSIDGTVGRLGYYSYFHHRQTDGFREANSDVSLFAGSAKLVLDAQTDSRWILNFDGYYEEHGEPGGLTLETGPNAVNYHADRNATSRFFDRFSLDRHFASLTWEKDFSEGTKLSVQSWGGYYNRWSKRQRGGGFGTLPTGPEAQTNTIEEQEFYTQGIEGRLRHDWILGENTHTFAGGLMYYHTFSPREDKRGTTPDAEEGSLRARSEREIHYAPVFLENRFVLGKFSATPGVRLENIWQSVRELVNVDKTNRPVPTPLGDEQEYTFVPLFGIGMEYELKPSVTAYANVAQSYRPKIFTQAVPTGGTTLVPADLEEGKAWQYELGLRGNPVPYLTWDTSLFLLDFDNQIGTVALPGGVSTVGNVGRAIHKGVEAALEFDLVGAYDAWQRTDLVRSYGSFSLYGNVTLLDAEFVSGPQEGRTPQYAADYVLRTGAIYRWRDRLKLAMLGTFVDKHFADDANAPGRAIPSYMTWDLTGEYRIYRNNLSIIAGINNLFDENYYARITNTGIDPAYGRNYYAGFALSF